MQNNKDKLKPKEKPKKMVLQLRLQDPCIVDIVGEHYRQVPGSPNLPEHLLLPQQLPRPKPQFSPTSLQLGFGSRTKLKCNIVISNINV